MSIAIRLCILLLIGAGLLFLLLAAWAAEAAGDCSRLVSPKRHRVQPLISVATIPNGEREERRRS
jgi:hypothetical protein